MKKLVAVLLFGQILLGCQQKQADVPNEPPTEQVKKETPKTESVKIRATLFEKAEQSAAKLRSTPADNLPERSKMMTDFDAEILRLQSRVKTDEEKKLLEIFQSLKTTELCINALSQIHHADEISFEIYSSKIEELKKHMRDELVDPNNTQTIENTIAVQRILKAKSDEVAALQEQLAHPVRGRNYTERNRLLNLLGATPAKLMGPTPAVCEINNHFNMVSKGYVPVHVSKKIGHISDDKWLLEPFSILELAKNQELKLIPAENITYTPYEPSKQYLFSKCKSFLEVIGSTLAANEKQ